MRRFVLEFTKTYLLEVGMEKKIYTVKRIAGEYAYLACEGESEELFIALALLPDGTDEGTVLEYENFEFSVIG